MASSYQRLPASHPAAHLLAAPGLRRQGGVSPERSSLSGTTTDGPLRPVAVQGGMLRLLESPGSRGDAAGQRKGAGSDSGGFGGARVPDRLGQLAALSRAGDADAQRTLLVTVGPAMLPVVRGVLGSRHPDVEDTLQEAMVAVHLALPGFRGECTTLHFACRIAIQTAMNARRRAAYRTHHTPSHEPEELAELARDDR